MQNSNYFGRKLTQLRKEKGLTRRELAQALGINEFTLTGYEREGREPKYDLLVKISDFFRVRIDDLLRPHNNKVDWFIDVDGEQYKIDGYSYEPNYDFPPEFEEFLMQNTTIDFVNMLVSALQGEITAREFFKDEYKSPKIFYPKKSSEINLHTEMLEAILNLNLKIERKNVTENNDQPKEV